MRLQQLALSNNTPIFICGHSLGAARALLYAYARVKRNLRVDGVYALAPPKPGDSTIGPWLNAIPIALSVINGRDIVPSVPEDVPQLNEEYVQPEPLIPILEQPSPTDLNPLSKWHHIELYVAGCHKLKQYGEVTIGDASDQIAQLYQTNQGWDWINPVSGSYWGMKIMPSGAKLMIARGSVTLKDWFDDFDAVQENQLGARVSSGFWAGIGPLMDQLDAQLV